MSNLLEKAIIDAKALKEAALKNAEQLVIEKYSEEVKNAVGRLLNEQELDDEMGDLGGLDDFGDDPFAGLEGDTEGLGTTEEPALDPAPEIGEEEQEPLDPDSLMGTLPDGFSADEDELVTIKLDSLDADYEDEDEIGVFGGDDDFSDDEIGIDIEDKFANEEPTDDEIDLSDLSVDDTAGPSAGIDVSQDMVQEILDEMGISEEEVDLDELLERVRVEGEPQKSGWAGTPESIMKEYEAMLLAREQDSKVKEENEELRKNVAALQKENKTLTSAAKKLQTNNNKYETAFNTLQEKLETMNVSNAKLLYINQALENASLNERQKRKIVEAISKAETVQEAKIVFDTMSDTVGTISDVKRDTTLNEMVSRKSSLLVAARNEQPKKDANPLFNRMQMLAGIKTQKS